MSKRYYCPASGGFIMSAKPQKKHSNRWFQTTVGEFVEAVYDAAMEEYMDEIMARRIAMQMLLRKLRLEQKLRQSLLKAHDKDNAER